MTCNTKIVPEHNNYKNSVNVIVSKLDWVQHSNTIDRTISSQRVVAPQGTRDKVAQILRQKDNQGTRG